MSTQWLPDVKRILSLAKSYRRAKGHERATAAAMVRAGVEDVPGHRLVTRHRHARVDVMDKREALIRFIETGKFEKRRTT